jgi:hypothetical protein
MTTEFADVKFDTYDFCQYLAEYEDGGGVVDYSASSSKIADSDCALNFVNVFRDKRIMACLRWESRRRKIVKIKVPPSRNGSVAALEFVNWLNGRKEDLEKFLDHSLPQCPGPQYAFRN